MRDERTGRWLLAAALLLAACTQDGDAGSGPTPGEPTGSTATGSTGTGPTGSRSPSSEPRGEPRGIPRVDLRQVATLEQPVAMAVRAGDRALYFAEKTGRVVALREGRTDVALDLAAEVSLGSEQGLLGLAFSPDGRLLYVDYTDVQGDTRIVEFAAGDDGVDAGSRREVLVVDQPFSNHNGGNLAFGPDGYLYVGLGDGGSAGDPQENAQSRSTLLGKMLRIAPRPSGGEPYGIPEDNPFVRRDDTRPEIWALGLRNPWRYSFDRETGDLWIGDIGQNAREEVDLLPAGAPGGANLGWDLVEGTLPFEGEAPRDAVAPVFEYPTGDGTCAVTGGSVYRGSAIPALVGVYVFGDFCRGHLEGLRLVDGSVRHDELGPVVPNLSSFGEDAEGELYVLSLSGPVYRIVPRA